MREFFVTVGCLAVLAVPLSGSSTAEAAGPASEAVLLTGKTWQAMTLDQRVAYVCGIGNLAEFDRTRESGRAMNRKSFIPYLVKGLSGKTINDIVRDVDAYYRANPGQVNRPVLDAIFRAIIIPKLAAARKGGNVQ